MDESAQPPLWLQRMLQLKRRLSNKLQQCINDLPPLRGASVPVRDMYNSLNDEAESANLYLEHSQLFPVGNLIGVSAAKPFAKGELICHYFGWIVLPEEFDEITSAKGRNIACSTAVYYCKRFTLIGYPDKVGSLINDPRKGLRPLHPNCTFSMSPTEGMTIKAMKAISVGEELLLSYGQNYWSEHQSFCYICTKRNDSPEDPLIECGGLHQRMKRYVQCCFAAHSSCLNVPSTQKRFKCYVCVAPDSGCSSLAGDMSKAKEQDLAQLLLSTAPTCSLLPPTLPTTKLATYCLDRALGGLKSCIGLPHPKRGNGSPLWRYATSEVVPSLFVLSTIARHIVSPTSSVYLQQVSTLYKEWFEEYAEFYAADDIWLYRVAALDRTDSVLATSKKTIAQLLRETQKLPELALSSRKNRGPQPSRRTFKYFVLECSYLWLRSSCSGDEQLWQSFEQNAAAALEILINRAKDFKLSYNRSVQLQFRLDDSSIHFIYAITHLVFWLSNWCTKPIATDVISEDVVIDAVVLLTSWIRNEIRACPSRLLQNHELWGEIAVSSITLMMGLSIDRLCDHISMKPAVVTLSSYYNSINAAFSKAGDVQLHSQIDEVSLFVASDFGRALMLDVNIHTHLIIGWFAVLMPELKSYLLRPNHSTSNATNATIQQQEDLKIPLENAASTKKSQDLCVSSSNLAPMFYLASDDCNYAHERMSQHGYVWLKGCFDRKTIEQLRQSTESQMELLSVIKCAEPVDITVQVSGGIHIGKSANEAILTQAYQNQVLDFGKSIVQPIVHQLGEPSTITLLQDEMFLRVKSGGTGTCAHYDSTEYLRSNKFNELTGFMPTSLVTCWIPLHDVTQQDGGLCLLQNSHKQYSSLAAAMKEKKRERPSNTDSLSTWLVGDFKAGDCIIFAGTMVHAASRNQTGKLRFSLDLRFCIPGQSIQINTPKPTRSLSCEFDCSSTDSDSSPEKLMEAFEAVDSSASQPVLSIQPSIEDILVSSGLYLVKVLGDGHCFYRSIAVAILGNEQLYLEVRREVHSWLKKRMQKNEIRRLLSELCQTISKGQNTLTNEQYVEKIIGQKPFPAGLAEIKAASEIYSLKIKVIYHQEALQCYQRREPIQTIISNNYLFRDIVTTRELVFHFIDDCHLNLITDDRAKRDEWRALSSAYDQLRVRLGGTVTVCSAPASPVSIDSHHCDSDEEKEKKYDSDYDTTNVVTAAIDTEADTEEVSSETDSTTKVTSANTNPKQLTYRRSTFELKRTASAPNKDLHKELLRIQKHHCDQLQSNKHTFPDIARYCRKLNKLKTDQKVKTDAPFEDINLQTTSFQSLQYLKLGPFYQDMIKVRDCCGFITTHGNAASILHDHVAIYKERLSLRVDCNWNKGRMYDWTLKHLRERIQKTDASKDAQVKWTYQHKVNGVPVCQRCFCRIYDFAVSTYGKKKMDSKKGIHYYVNRASVNRERGRKLEKAERWMKEIVAPYLEFIPNGGKAILKTSMHQIRKVVREFMQEEVSDSTLDRAYNNVWSAMVSKGRTHGMAKCDTCQRLENQIRTAKDETDKADCKAALETHRENARMERLTLEDNIKYCTNNPNLSTLILIDGMDQAKTDLPKVKKDQLSKKLEGQRSTLKTRITGALVFGGGGPPRLYFYLTYSDEVHVNANLTLTVLIDVLDKSRRGIPWVEQFDDSQLLEFGLMGRNEYGSYRPLPPKLVIQMDNTSKENKNHALMTAMSYLVRLNFVKEVHTNFLVTGHTHSHIDQTFSCVSKRISKYNVLTVDSLVDHMQKSYLLDPIKNMEEYKTYEAAKPAHTNAKESMLASVNKLLQTLQSKLRPAITILRRTTDFTAWFVKFPQWEGVKNCHHYRFFKATEYSTDDTVYMVARKFSMSTDKSDISTIPVLDHRQQLPTELPLMEPTHTVNTQELMDVIDVISSDLHYFEVKGDEYNSFVKLCKEFDDLRSKTCKTCDRIRTERRRLELEKPRKRDQDKDEEIKKKAKDIGNQIKGADKQLMLHMLNVASDEPQHPATDLRLIIEAVEGLSIFMKPFAEEPDDPLNRYQNSAASMTSINASMDKSLSVAERSIAGPRVRIRGVKYQDKSKPIEKNTIVVLQPLHNIERFPGYPFSLAQVTKVTKRTANEPNILEIVWLLRAYQEDESELLKWYYDIKNAKEKNYMISIKLGELDTYEYKAEIENNQHTEDVIRVYKAHDVNLPGEKEEKKDESALTRPIKKRFKVSDKRHVSAAAPAATKRKSLRKRKDVKYTEVDEEGKEAAPSLADEHANLEEPQIIHDVKIPAKFFKLADGLDFSHHFDKRQVPNHYVRAFECDVINDDVNIQEWLWGPDQNDIFGPSKAIESEVIAWDTPNNALVGWSKSSAPNARQQDRWKKSYKLDPKFLNIIKTEFICLDAQAASTSNQQHALQLREQQQAIFQKRAAEIAAQPKLGSVMSASITPNSDSPQLSNDAIEALANRLQSNEAVQNQNSLQVFNRVRYALKDKMCCLSQQSIATIDDEISADQCLHRRYLVMNHRHDDVYTVDIKHQPRCTCPDFISSTTRCKHIYFVLLRVLKLVDLDLEADLASGAIKMNKSQTKELSYCLDLMYRPTYTDTELRCLFNNTAAPPMYHEQERLLISPAAPKRRAPRGPSSPLVQQKEPEKGDECCICYERLTIDQQLKNELAYCRARCAVNIHQECFKVWHHHRSKDKCVLICPHCRAEWI